MRSYVGLGDEPDEVEEHGGCQHGQRGLDGVLVEVVEEEDGEDQHVGEEVEEVVPHEHAHDLQQEADQGQDEHQLQTTALLPGRGLVREDAALVLGPAEAIPVQRGLGQPRRPHGRNMEGRAQQLVILLKLLDILDKLPLLLRDSRVQPPLALLDMLIEDGMRSEDGVDVIPQQHGVGAVLLGLLEQFQRHLAVELGLVHVGLHDLIQRVVYLVLVQAGGLAVAHPRELVGDLPVVGHRGQY